MSPEPFPLGLPDRPAPSPSLSEDGVIGEVTALAPDTFVVPGWWPVPGTERGLQTASLVVRGAATAVVDTGLAAMAPEWLNAVLCVVDPAELRWIVLTGSDPVRTGGLDALLAVSPGATVISLDGRQGRLDLDDRTLELVTAGAGHPAVVVPDRGVVWADVLGGTFVRPTPDVASATDDDLLAALGRRADHPTAARIAALAALEPRVLASPCGPAARGRRSVARALDLVARARDAAPGTAFRRP